MEKLFLQFRNQQQKNTQVQLKKIEAPKSVFRRVICVFSKVGVALNMGGNDRHYYFICELVSEAEHGFVQSFA